MLTYLLHGHHHIMFNLLSLFPTRTLCTKWYQCPLDKLENMFLICRLIQEIFKLKGRRPQWKTTGQSVSPQLNPKPPLICLETSLYSSSSVLLRVRIVLCFLYKLRPVSCEGGGQGRGWQRDKVTLINWLTHCSQLR